MKKSIDILKNLGRPFRLSEVTGLGVHPSTIYRLRDKGEVGEISRGVFYLTDLELSTDPDLIGIAARVTRAVICLVSALSFHGITTQVAHSVDIALPQGVKSPRISYPPTRIFHMSQNSYQAGIEVHNIDGVSIRVYSVEKTIADCFKFRNQIGMETVMEALRLGLNEKGVTVSKILHFARICRVESVIHPYIEILLSY